MGQLMNGEIRKHRVSGRQACGELRVLMIKGKKEYADKYQAEVVGDQDDRIRLERPPALLL